MGVTGILMQIAFCFRKLLQSAREKSSFIQILTLGDTHMGNQISWKGELVIDEMAKDSLLHWSSQ